MEMSKQPLLLVAQQTYLLWWSVALNGKVMVIIVLSHSTKVQYTLNWNNLNFYKQHELYRNRKKKLRFLLDDSSWKRRLHMLVDKEWNEHVLKLQPHALWKDCFHAITNVITNGEEIWSRDLKPTDVCQRCKASGIV